jgi:hypothetical protein
MPTEAQSNVTDETLLEALAELRPLRRAAQAASGKYSKGLAKWAKAGVDRKAVQAAMAARDLDHEEVKETQRQTIRLMALINMPLTEADLFGGAPIPTKIVEQVSLDDVFDVGYLAGKGGRGLDDNPYNGEPGSERFIRWRDGWQQGQLENAYPAGDPKKADATRGL